MERDCCELIYGTPTTFQGYGIELNRIEWVRGGDVGLIAGLQKIF